MGCKPSKRAAVRPITPDDSGSLSSTSADAGSKRNAKDTSSTSVVEMPVRTVALAEHEALKEAMVRTRHAPRATRAWYLMKVCCLLPAACLSLIHI